MPLCLSGRIPRGRDRVRHIKFTVYLSKEEDEQFDKIRGEHVPSKAVAILLMTELKMMMGEDTSPVRDAQGRFVARCKCPECGGSLGGPSAAPCERCGKLVPLGTRKKTEQDDFQEEE